MVFNALYASIAIQPTNQPANQPVSQPANQLVIEHFRCAFPAFKQHFCHKLCLCCVCLSVCFTFNSTVITTTTTTGKKTDSKVILILQPFTSTKDEKPQKAKMSTIVAADTKQQPQQQQKQQKQLRIFSLSCNIFFSLSHLIFDIQIQATKHSSF